MKKVDKVAYEMGKKAYEAGKKCVPAMDEEFLQTFCKGPVGSSINASKSWAKGWIDADIAQFVFEA